MLLDIVAVKPLTNYHLQIEFEDETIGIVNVATLIPFTGVFAPLEDEDYLEWEKRCPKYVCNSIRSFRFWYDKTFSINLGEEFNILL